jgi:protein-S-isoprenylcysteine O-methyltransferase Ste14
MNTVALRFLPALLLVSYFAHRAHYFRKVRHASDSVALQPTEPAAALGLALAILTLVANIVYVALPERIRWASLPLPAWLRWAGLALALAAFALLEWCHATLGRNWSGRVQVLKEHELVVGGPYRWVRHPMYTAGLMASVSALLLSANWLVGGSWLAMHICQFAGRIPLEERLMVEQFGDAYRQYMRTTGRLLPRILPRG